MQAKNKTFIVTGAGAGMGREITFELLKRGARVAAVDINQDSLEETRRLVGTKEKNLSLHAIDITKQSFVERLPEDVIAFHGSVDGIINNAGVIQPFIDVLDLDMKQIRFVMDVNFYGTLYMVKALLPYFIKNSEAHIVNISSMGGFLPVPGQSIYGASKAAVKLLTEGLQSELKDTNVKVTVVFPGAIKTDIMKNSNIKNGPMIAENEEIANKITTPQDAAKMILDGMEKNKQKILIGKDAKVMDIFYRLMPKKAAAIIREKLK